MSILGKTKEIALDGWQNLLTGMGILNRDKTKSTRYDYDTMLTEQDMTSLFRGEGFARRIVELPVGDMTRKGFAVEGDTDGKIFAAFEGLGGDLHVRNLLRWSKVYGGGLLVFRINDGGELMDPLKEDNIKEIEDIRVFQRFRVDRTSNVETDPNSMNYGNAIAYRVTPPSGAMFEVHPSRTILLDGIELPEEEKKKNANWGDSIYNATYQQIRSLGTVFQNLENITEDFVTGWLQMNNLQEMIASGQEALIQKRLELLDQSRHIINTRLLDQNEKYEKVTTSVAGLPDIVDRFAQRLAGVTGIPITLLMGTSPKGLQATGQSDIRFYYDNIASQQKQILLPVLNRFIYLILKSKSGPMHGKEPENWKIIFAPLWEATEKEITEQRKETAEMDKMYMDAGVLDPSEVRESRFGGDQYSMETKITKEGTAALEGGDGDEGNE